MWECRGMGNSKLVRCSQTQIFLLFSSTEILNEPSKNNNEEIDAGDLKQLMDMGFPENRARKALLLNRWVGFYLHFLLRSNEKWPKIRETDNLTNLWRTNLAVLRLSDLSKRTELKTEWIRIKYFAKKNMPLMVSSKGVQ